MLEQIDDSYDAFSASQLIQERPEVAVLRHSPLALPDLMRLLGTHQVFVEYVLGRHSSYALEISSFGMKVHRLVGNEQLSKLSSRYLKKLESGVDARSESQALYSALLDPATSQWDSIIVAPDGPLHLIPFNSLLDANSRYLIQRATIDIAPSANVWATLRREAEIAAPKPFLGIAFSETAGGPIPAADKRGVADIRGADIKPLQFAREEVVQANLALGGNGVLLEGPDASERALKSQPLSQFGVIHIAAHGFGDEVSRTVPRLYFIPAIQLRMDCGRLEKFAIRD